MLRGRAEHLPQASQRGGIDTLAEQPPQEAEQGLSLVEDHAQVAAGATARAATRRAPGRLTRRRQDT